MSPRLRSVLAQAGSFALAGALLYLALRGVDLSSIGEALRHADYRWLIPLLGMALIAHLLRAWRWQVLLEALPPEESDAPARPVSLRVAFYSVMIGYMVNYAAPRLGELARTANLATQEQRSFSGVFGTVFVDRVLDAAVLALALLTLPLLFLDRLALLDAFLLQPAARQLDALPAGVLAALALGVGILVFFIYRYAVRHERVAGLWRERVQPVLLSFKDGLLTLLRTRRRGVLLLSTVGMWVCYGLMAYLPLLMLGMAQAYGLNLVDAWGLMLLGALGIVVPSPGGTGSYHYITIQALVHLFGVPEAPAATYAVLTHGAQLVLYVIVGAGCLLAQGSSLRALRRTTRAARQQTGAPDKKA